MSKIVGKLLPLKDKIFVTDMEFGEQKTALGIVIPSNDGKSSGIHPRWGRVWAVGPEQTEIKVGEWILMEHARWSRKIEYENEDGSITELHLADNAAILLVSDERPSDVDSRVMGTFNLNT
jgi:co-chaperonin GroES (HSP10)